MSRFSRVGRRPDHWSSPHERARMRIAERMSGDIGVDETAWLEAHLESCALCTAVAAQYTADRDALRALRGAAPEPPRDLWARTAAAIEQEAGGRPVTAAAASRRTSRIPLGALSGIAVIALVVGVSTLSGGIGNWNTPDSATDKPSDRVSTTGGEEGSEPVGPRATPFTVGAGAVSWVDKDADGRMGFNRADIDEVCPSEMSGCPVLEQPTQERLALDTQPRTIIGSPTDGQAVVISDDLSGGTRLLLLDLPEGTPTPEATPSAAASPTPTATETARDTASPSLASETPAPSADVPSSSPTESPGTDTSAGTPSPTPVLVSASPSLSPSPSVAASLAIASDIELVGESAAFSADGSWFAFTARPADGSRGPDVYIWRVGDATARALTTDGSTVFASWDGGLVVASRPDSATSAEGAVSAVTVRIDPASSVETPAGDMWRPVVDPTRKRVIGWSGTIVRSADASSWTPETGTLELQGWTETGSTPAGAGQGRDPGRVVADAASAGFDVRWDERGEWVAIWIADAVDPNVGRLSLYRVNAGRDRLEIPHNLPTGVPALPGFSIGHGRLAWATPPGQDGEGSRIQIVAWNDDGVGTIESAPGEDLVVIR